MFSVEWFVNFERSALRRATAPPMWKLVIEDDEAKRTSVPLTRDDYTIGRKEGNTIRLTERNVSRDHAKIKKANGAPITAPDSPFVLEDVNSYNGVYVNGVKLNEGRKADRTKGKIALQSEGAPILFRNIVLTPLE